MHVTNQTKQVLVFGKTMISPQASGELPPEFEDHDTVDLLIRLRKITPSVSYDTAPTPVEQMFVKPAPEVETADPVVFEADDALPIGFDEWHANKCYAWIKKQTNVVLLSKMAAIEDRPKVQAKLEARIAELQGD